MWVWIKRNKGLCVKIIVVVFVALFIIPMIINALYLGDIWYRTVWEGKDILEFYGNVLAFLGTVFLGGLALWQNKELNEINQNLMEHQYKPVLYANITRPRLDATEELRMCCRIIEQNDNSEMVNNGYGNRCIQGVTYFAIPLSNIGLGPAVEIETYMHRLKSIDGLDSLDEIVIKSTEDLYDKMKIENFSYYEDGKRIEGEWRIYTDFSLGISDENNRLNFAFSFQNIKESVHSIIEFRYKGVLGNKLKQYLYIGCINGGTVIYPISRIY